MKTKFKAIIAAAVTAAMSLGIVATATADTAVEPEIMPQEGGLVWIAVDETETELESDVDSFEIFSGYTPFELNILSGKKAVDLNRCYDWGDFSGTSLDISAQSTSSVISLTKVHDSSQGYTLWEGRFITDSVTVFSASFGQPQYFNCTVGNTSSMTVNSNMVGDYAKVDVVYTFWKYDIYGNKTIVPVRSTKTGTSQTVSAAAPTYGTALLVEATYNFYLYSSPNSNAPLLEMVSVHVIRKGYETTAEYAEQSYANLIDSYTYVDTSDFADA